MGAWFSFGGPRPPLATCLHETFEVHLHFGLNFSVSLQIRFVDKLAVVFFLPVAVCMQIKVFPHLVLYYFLTSRCGNLTVIYYTVAVARIF